MKKITMAVGVMFLSYSTPAFAGLGDCLKVYSNLGDAVAIYVKYEDQARVLVQNNKADTDEYDQVSSYMETALDTAAKLSQVYGVYCN